MLRRVIIGAMIAGLAIGAWSTYQWASHRVSVSYRVGDHAFDRPLWHDGVAYFAADFGTEWAQDEIRRSVTITNQTGRPLEIARFQTSCGCTKVVPDSLTLASHEAAEVEVVINLASVGFVGALDSPDESKPASFVVTPRLKSGQRLEALQLLGMVKPPFSAQPHSIKVDPSLVTGQPSEAGSVLIEMSPGVKAVEATSNVPYLEVAARPLGERRSSLILTFTGQALPGPVSSVVSVRPVKEDGTVLPALSLAVQGRVINDIFVEPSVLHVGGPLGHENTSGESNPTGWPTFVVASRSGLPLNNVHVVAKHSPESVSLSTEVTRVQPDKVSVRLNLKERPKTGQVIHLAIDGEIAGIVHRIELPVILMPNEIVSASPLKPQTVEAN
ncbi:MAG: DUF1573 domain-containing protein [Pirellulales bacterium]